MNRATIISVIAILVLPYLLSAQDRLPIDEPVPWSPENQAKAQNSKRPVNCEEKVQAWTDWAARNIPIHKKLLAAHEQLLESSKELDSNYQSLSVKYSEVISEKKAWHYLVNPGWIALIILGIVIGAALFAAHHTFLLVQRCWPLSPARKQLAVLIMGAIWISGASFLGLANNSLSRHPINLAFKVGVASTPAVLFCGIAFWWLRKKMDARLGNAGNSIQR